MTRSGRLRPHPGLSPGVAGKGFCVAGYFGGVMFGVCVGSRWCVSCVRARVWCVLCVRVFDGVGHVACCVSGVDVSCFV
nr:MAG TPA: hypothetical protein [Caudoviricetes sp.]